MPNQTCPARSESDTEGMELLRHFQERDIDVCGQRHEYDAFVTRQSNVEEGNNDRCKQVDHVRWQLVPEHVRAFFAELEAKLDANKK
jgi:hypothetical protein